MSSESFLMFELRFTVEAKQGSVLLVTSVSFGKNVRDSSTHRRGTAHSTGDSFQQVVSVVSSRPLSKG